MTDESMQWADAKSFADLCELTARFLEGRIKENPVYDADSPAPETLPLVPMLASFNRAGFLTDMSQPGVPLDELGDGQRAYVTGCATKDVAFRIDRLTLYSDLYVAIAPYGVPKGCQIPVTLDSFRPFSWCGVLPNRGDGNLERFAEACNPGIKDALEALWPLWAVSVVDLQWGRNDYLWTRVHAELTGTADVDARFCVSPSPDLNLGFEFYY